MWPSAFGIRRWLAVFFLLLSFASLSIADVPDTPITFIDSQIGKNRGKSGVYVLETGEEALLARAWLADNAQSAIDVQYFIWSTDNIGILAAESLLRAAERGVRVRVIVDDLLIDAPDEYLLALAMHPNIDIRIYNPKTSVGIPITKRILNVITNFRGVNQRMHDKTVIVDGKVAITGGRNMATEYYDYNHQYNFRDRDALVLGEVAQSMQASFENFWSSQLTVPVEALYDGFGLLQKSVKVNDEDIRRAYQELRDYAASPENFAPEVRAAIAATPTAFLRLTKQIVWGRVDFISDDPGKNDSRMSLRGGGRATTALGRLVESARESVVIQSPYLVVSDDAIRLLQRLIDRGVRVRVSTNSLASTDNLAAFSGYRDQRSRLLKMGIDIHEYRPDAAIQRQLMNRVNAPKDKSPIFSLHAKTLVVDKRVTYIGTFNFDPRSENLNTEVGVVVHSEAVASAVQQAIEMDMRPANSWNAATEDPDKRVPLLKRGKVRVLQILPIESLL